MECLQGIQIAGTVDKLNSASLNAFVKGIDGLTLSQAQAALSTKALTNAQKEQILTSAKLLQTKESLALTEVKEMASSMSLSAQKKEEILTTLQGAIVENEWNEEKLEAIIASGGEAGAIAQVILAKKAENVENIKGIAGRKALTASLWAELKARLALMATNPAVWIAGIIGAGIGLIALQKKLTKSLEECNEELQEYNSKFETAQSEAKSLESELANCETRLRELEKLAENGTISIIEQEELDRLKETNEELDRNLRIQQEKAQLSAIEGAKTADDTLKKIVSSEYVTTTMYDGTTGASYWVNANIAPQEELDAAISEYQRLQTEIDNLNKTYDDGNISVEEYEKQLVNLTDQQTDARTRASEMGDILVEAEQAYANLINTGGALTTTQRNNYNSVSQANEKYNEFLGAINGVNDAFEKLDTTEKSQALKNKYAQKTISLPNGAGSYTVENKEISNWIDTLSDEDLTVLATINFSGEQTKESMDKALQYAKTHIETSNETRIPLGISETIDALNTKLKPTMDSLKSAYQDIFTEDGFTLDNVGTDMLQSIKETIDELNDEKGLNLGIDYSAFEEFAQVLSNTSSTEEQVHEQFDKLASSIVEATGSAEISAENFTVLSKALVEMGLVNADEVLTNIKTAQDELIAQGYDLTDITEEQARAFIEEGEASAITVEYLRMYMIQKQLAEQPINTSGDIEALESLCNSLGVTGELMENIIRLKSLLKTSETMGDNWQFSSQVNAEIESYRAKIEELASGKGGSFEFNFDTPTGNDNKKKSSSSDKDTSKEFDWIERRIENIEGRMSRLRKVSDSAYSTFGAKNQALADQIHLVNEEIQLQQQAYEGYMEKANSIGLSDDYKKLVQEGAINIEKITDKELQEAISNYSEWYEKAKETQDKITDLHEQSKDLRVEAADNGANELKELLDHQAITEREYIDRMNDLWEFYYANQVELAEVAKDKKLELLEEEKSYLQSVGSAAIALLDDQIDDLEDQKDSAVQGYKDQIEVLENLKKPLEDQLEMMEKAKEKEEKILALQKAQYELKRAQNQRDQLKFVDGQMVYTADDKAVRDAQKDVDDAEFELSKFKIQEQIDAYDRQIEKLNELIDDTEKYYDKQIKGLNEYKEEWQKAIDMEELAVNMQNFIDKFGEGSIGKLLSGDMSLITTWKQSYLDTLKEIDMTSNGTIGDITNKFKELSGLDFSPSVTGISEASDKMSALADSANNAASAIGGATGGANAQQGEKTQGGGNTSGGTNLVGAIGEVKTATDTALGSNGGEGKEGELSEGGGEGAIGKFSQFKTAVDAVTQAIGTGEEEEGSGEEGAINLIGALQTQYEIASEILPEEIAFFNELLASIMACVDGLNAMATSISSVSGVSVTPHAEGTVGKAFASGTGNYKGLAHAEKNALRSEYGQPELTVYPDGTTELTTEPTMSDLPKDTVIFNEEQTKRIMNNEGTVIGNAYADGNAVLQKASTPSYLRPIQEGDKGYELIKAARVYQDMLKTNIMLPVSSIDKNVDMMARNISAVNNHTNVNSSPVVNMTVNCPGITSKEVANQVSNELEKAVFGMSNLARQKASITR